MYDMDVAAFRAWLQSRPSSEIVGWVAEETACPVARWMSGVYRRDFRVSGSSVFTDDVPFESFVAPLWRGPAIVEFTGATRNPVLSRSLRCAALANRNLLRS